MSGAGHDGHDGLACFGCHSPVYKDPYSIDKQNRYISRRKLGEGAFGQVHLADDRETGNKVALKSISCSLGGGGRHAASDTAAPRLPKAVFRELYAMRQLQHANILPLLDVFPRADSVVLVLELMVTDLEAVLSACTAPMFEGEAKGWLAQMFAGVAHMHSMGLLHRDLKPGNLLINSGGVLKIGDFGLTRVHDPECPRSMSHQVATRWYRAPELLFGARRYTAAVDAWAAGCVLAELLFNKPLFPGQSDIDQLIRVLRVTGTPTAATWPGACETPDFDKIAFAHMEPAPLAALCPGSSAQAMGLLAALLTLDPLRRATAADALCHDWFLCAPAPIPPPQLHVPCVAAYSSSARMPAHGAEYLDGFDVQLDDDLSGDGGGGGIVMLQPAQEVAS
ncbi:cyclin-dependent kinase 20-like protein [Tribonema minus]|uniref:Cyclin-dependent kinase 2 homolog n=1 Tax=Tribonema minus TaxID=303371 RepID=A0A835YXT6_9STRA|nr:cyclin-dependent kinase 20-like protein [Tribonema minus]